jgi:hypothetical protein
VDGQRHVPAALPPGKIRYPFYRRLGGSQGRFGRMRKISPPPGFDPRTLGRNQSLYRLSYSGPVIIHTYVRIGPLTFSGKRVVERGERSFTYTYGGRIC